MQAIYLVDTKGLITNTRGDDLPDHKKFFMREDGTPDMKVRILTCCRSLCRLAIRGKFGRIERL